MAQKEEHKIEGIGDSASHPPSKFGEAHRRESRDESRMGKASFGTARVQSAVPTSKSRASSPSLEGDEEAKEDQGDAEQPGAFVSPIYTDPDTGRGRQPRIGSKGQENAVIQGVPCAEPVDQEALAEQESRLRAYLAHDSDAIQQQ